MLQFNLSVIKVLDLRMLQAGIELHQNGGGYRTERNTVHGTKHQRFLQKKESSLS